MSDPATEDDLAAVRAMRLSLTNAWNAFFARFGGRLRPVQKAAIPLILTGKNLLVCAPTAGGKTEAAAAPLCERMIARRWAGLSVLMVTPTRALVNDLFHRLESPCAEMGIRLRRKTADHSLAGSSGEQFLITTPESVESLLTFQRSRLAQVQAVIVDEIHLLEGTPRGDQLRLLLNRLRAYLRHQRGPAIASPFQVVAVSATVANPQRIVNHFLEGTAEIVRVEGQREIEARIFTVAASDEMRAAKAMEATANFAEVNKVLVFVNSRSQADDAKLYQAGPFAGAPVYGHHGSLSKNQREETEQRFKAERRAVCLATTTMEVGIDIGDVDLIVLIDPPFSLSSFLQRIGRGCRRQMGLTRVLCVARDEASRWMFEALLQQARNGMPPVPSRPLRRSVLFQQTLAYLQQVDQHRRTLPQFISAFALEDENERQMLASVLDDQAAGGCIAVRNGIHQLASVGKDFTESTRIYSNFTSPQRLALVDVDTGLTVATIGETEVGATGVRIAGRSYKFVSDAANGQRKVRQQNASDTAAIYGRSKLPYAADVAIALRNHLGIAADQLAVLRNGDRAFIFTWLGALENSAVASLLRRQQIEANAAAFGLSIPWSRAGEWLNPLNVALGRTDNNPFSELEIKNLVDLGAHYQELSEAEQRKARCDFYSRQVIDDWRNGLTLCRVVDASTELARGLVALSGVK